MASAASAGMKQRILNFNVGVLGHIDSGKTSLSKALSTTASTASFDKNPQSKERGITLDLGFSSFAVPLPEQLKSQPYDVLQFTLVDCPGHGSLIKTIIGMKVDANPMICTKGLAKRGCPRSNPGMCQCGGGDTPLSNLVEFMTGKNETC